jgi:hypothetical protein
VKHEEDISTSRDAHLSIGDKRMARDEASVEGQPGELALVHDRADATDESGTPLGMPAKVPPAVDRRAGHRRTFKGHVMQGEALVPGYHDSTVTDGPRRTSHRPVCDGSVGPHAFARHEPHHYDAGMKGIIDLSQ